MGKVIFTSKLVLKAINDLTHAGFIIKEQRYRENGGNSNNLYVLRK